MRPLEEAELREIAREILEFATRDPDGFIEFEREGASMIQFREYRIAIYAGNEPEDGLVFGENRDEFPTARTCGNPGPHSSAGILRVRGGHFHVLR